MRRALLISPYFPPMGVSGAKRALHLARNLPSAGWTPVVLASPPVGEPHDPTLAACIPPETVVSYDFIGGLRPAMQRLKALRLTTPRSARSARPKKAGGPPRRTLIKQDLTFLTPFDRFLVDVPAGLRAARRLVAEHQPSVIHVSADPWAPLIVALKLHRETELPLVVDFRDPWSQHRGKMALRPKRAQQWLRRFEAELFEAAGRVVLNTEAARDVYREAYADRLPAERFVAVRNAFDEGLFLPGELTPDPAFTVTYFGRFRRFVDPDALLDGFARFVRARGLDRTKARLQLVGGLSAEHRARAEGFGIDTYLDVRPPVPFRESLPLLQSADVLALVIQPESHLQIPGKLYDYLAAGRPILAVSANPEADRIVEGANAGLCARHGDAAHVAEQLGRLYDARKDGAFTPTVEALEPYSARAQARQIGAIYDALCP